MKHRAQTVLHGHCHCGAIKCEFKSALPIADIPVRSCDCNFCRRHGAKTFTDPAGKFLLEFQEDSVSRYSFSKRTAEAIICSKCGVYTCMIITDEAGRLYSTVNAGGLGIQELSVKHPTAVTYSTETRSQRVNRRLDRWTPTQIRTKKRISSKNSSKQVDFYYDIRSPFSYLAWARRDIVTSAAAELNLKPVSIDVLLNLQRGAKPWATYLDPLCPQKRRHLMADIERLSRYWDIPISIDLNFKPSAVRLMGVASNMYAAGEDQKELIGEAQKCLWQFGCDLENNDTFEELMTKLGRPIPTKKQEQLGLKRLTENSIAAFDKGVFGVPTFAFDQRVFFGVDRMELLAAELLSKL